MQLQLLIQIWNIYEVTWRWVQNVDDIEIDAAAVTVALASMHWFN